MTPSAGEFLGALCGLANFMITDVIPPAASASTEALHAVNPQFRAVSVENTMAWWAVIPEPLPIIRPRCSAAGLLRPRGRTL